MNQKFFISCLTLLSFMQARAEFYLSSTDGFETIDNSNVNPSPSLNQSKEVKGLVVDKRNKDSIIGANIMIKGTTIGTITDFNGNFTLNVKLGDILVISYIGYKTFELTINDSDFYNIELIEDAESLEEVIVIGYGTTKKKDFTGSVSSIKLEDSPVSLATNLNALESLKGNVAGLDIGATNSAGGEPSMQIRGQKSISGSNDPLIVVDGMIYMGKINDINPNDIASFDVLKDATSAAAYGSRSANGVIIITTKKGKTGKPTISFNASASIQTWQNMPELMKGEQWIEAVQARNNSSDLSWLEPQELANRELGKETNWLKESTRTGLIQDYQVAVSGSGEKVNYYLSAAYSNNKGVIIGDDYDRLTTMIKLNSDITDWLQIGFDGGFSQSNYSNLRANLAYATKMSPYGVMYRDEENKLLEKFPYTQARINPLWDVEGGGKDGFDKRNSFRINSFALLKCPWIEGLSYRFNYSTTLEKNQEGIFYNELYYVNEGAYNDENRYSPDALQSLLVKANGSIENVSSSTWLIDNILNYNKNFGRHNIDLTAVATRDRKVYESVKSSGSDFSSNGNTTLGVYGLHKAGVNKVVIDRYIRSNIGYLGRLSYSYDDKYYFTSSYRRDGASVFGANLKWGDFFAVGSAWRISSEKFMKSLSWIDDLKLKLSWGRNGNQGLEPYGTLSTISNGSSGNIRYEFGGSDIYYGLRQQTLGNIDLGWETTESWNIGFESSLLNNRLFFDLDLYFSKTTDQIFERDIPIMTGFGKMKSSMGQVNNRGVEMSIRSVNISNNDWNWTTNLTFWLNRNKLVHLYGEDLDGDGKEDDDISNSRFIGKPLGAIYGYEQNGIVQESDIDYIEKNSVKPGTPKYVDQNGDGVITSDDRKILGYSTPNFKLNMSNTVSYKNWTLYFMLTGTFGGGGYYLKSNTGAYMLTTDGYFNSNGIYIPWWTPENKSNVYPAASFTNDNRFLGLQNRAFVRLQDLTLSYTFKSNQLKKIGIGNLKAFVTSKNLFTITKWEGGDPDLGIGVNSYDQPLLSSFTFGINVSL